MSTPEYYAQKILLNHNITSLPIETEVLIKIINSYGYGVKCIENYKADLKIVLKELNIYGKLKDAQGYALNINNMKAVFL